MFSFSDANSKKVAWKVGNEMAEHAQWCKDIQQSKEMLIKALDVCYLKYQTLQASILFSSKVLGLLNKLFNRY